MHTFMYIYIYMYTYFTWACLYVKIKLLVTEEYINKLEVKIRNNS